MAQPEAQLVAAIKDTLRASCPGAFVIKLHGSAFMATGLPDLLMFWQGRPFAFEVKHQRVSEGKDRARGRCTPAQRETLRKLRAAGVRADCVLSPGEAVAVVQGAPYFLQELVPENA